MTFPAVILTHTIYPVGNV